MNMVATILLEVRSKTVKRAKDLKESAEMHRTIYRAIRERNPEAARDAMRDHLMLAQKAQEGLYVDAHGRRRLLIISLRFYAALGLFSAPIDIQ
jgi:DNA-binding FadR family transcriptional regulator